jgi:hypothetical protein
MRGDGLPRRRGWSSRPRRPGTCSPPDNIADPAGDLANLEDHADPAGGLADLEDAMAGLMAEPAGPDDPGDALAFPWHLPEGMVLPAIAPEQPMMNGYHIVLPPLHPPHGEAG